MGAAKLGSVALSFGLLLSVGDAFGQELQTATIEVPRFQPAPVGDRFFGVPSPYAAGDLSVHAGIAFDYAREPFTLVSDPATRDADSEEIGAVVSDQAFLHLGVNFSMASYVTINANMPFALLNSGDAPSGENLSFTEPGGAAIGDLRLGIRVRLIGKYYDPFQLSAAGYIWAPTGTESAYVTDHYVRGQPHIIMGGREDRFVWSTSVGPTFRRFTDVGPVTIGHSMNWGVGVGVLLLSDRTFQLNAESYGGVDVNTPSAQTTNAELIAGLKWRLPGANFLEIGLGGGPGIASGIGTPLARGIFSFSYTEVVPPAKVVVPPPPLPTPRPVVVPLPKDRDADGILDEVDACPDEPGVPTTDPKTHGCPLPKDRDADGILDEVDACPDVAGVATTDPKTNGCPLPKDKDGDGIFDEADACIDIPGVKGEDPKANGCPPDSDGDSFRDDQDACPKEKGVDDADPSKRGCPKLVRFTEKEIVILEQVQFDTGKATIRAVSNELLDSVAQVLKDHPEVLKLEIQGHTDNRGARTLNQKLSDDRAKSVRDALTKRGVDGSRLVAKGYGMDKPIAENTTEPGRQQNRRVQFIVLEKKATPNPTQQVPSTPAIPKP